MFFFFLNTIIQEIKRKRFVKEPKGESWELFCSCTATNPLRSAAAPFLLQHETKAPVFTGIVAFCCLDSTCWHSSLLIWSEGDRPSSCGQRTSSELCFSRCVKTAPCVRAPAAPPGQSFQRRLVSFSLENHQPVGDWRECSVPLDTFGPTDSSGWKHFALFSDCWGSGSPRKT